MPKKACCCNASGRHIAVACRYYDTHSLYWLTGSTAPGKMGLGGPDGFQGITGGYQKLFGVTSFIDFGIEYFTVRGPQYPERVQQGAETNYVTIQKFDSTRDVIILSRGGGGGSQHNYNSGSPKGGNAALTQSRLLADLSLEGSPGTGGRSYDGGGASILGYNISAQGNEEGEIITGAGGAGAAFGAGGHGGITNGFTGSGSMPGGAGSQTSGGKAGGPRAKDGKKIEGGEGWESSGGGGGGNYGGGGGEEQSGGGGGSSFWPDDKQSEITGNALTDSIFNRDGTDIGPGDVCNPFIAYYKLEDSNTPIYHSGMGGGVNVFQDEGKNSLGFGVDYNPQKIGVPGVITAVWLSKYCPCNELSKEIPDMMYICLTDTQYQTIETFKQDNNIDPTYPFIRFDLDGETYIYYGICQGVYCDNLRIVDGELTNLAYSGEPTEDQEGNPIPLAGNAYRMNSCCEAIISRPICQIIGGDCLTCNSCQQPGCNYDVVKPKYCCEGIEDKPDIFWSVSEGYVWESTKNKNFWYDFKTTPETLSQTSPFSTDYEQGCLPVQYTLTEDNQVPPEVSELCSTGQGNCDDYNRDDPDGQCYVKLQGRAWRETPLRWSISVESSVCDKKQKHPGFRWKGECTDVFDCTEAELCAIATNPPCCDCVLDPFGTESCRCFGCVESSRPFNYTVNVRPDGLYEPVKWDTTSCQTGLFYAPYTVGGNAFIEYVSDSPNRCNRRVLGFTQRIRRCHPNDKPSITDPLSAVGLQSSAAGIGWILCEKQLEIVPDPTIAGKGYVTLGEIILALSNNLKSGISFTVNEPDLWLSDRVVRDSSVSGGFTVLPGDSFYGTVTREYMDYQETEFWFTPSSTSWVVGAKVGFAPNLDNASLCGSDPPFCHPICECATDYKSSISYSLYKNYWSKAYYYYEHPNGDAPQLYPSVFVPNYDASPYGDIGTNYAPMNVLNSFCRNETESLIGNSNQNFGASICTQYNVIEDPCSSGGAYWTVESSSVRCQTRITNVKFV